MRATRRKAKPGQVIFFHGRLPGDAPDFIGMWGGQGATKRHSNLVMDNFTQKKEWPHLGEKARSFIEELDAAGFDVTTIEFGIRMKPKHDAR